jgi:Bacterial TSP3 repeat
MKPSLFLHDHTRPNVTGRRPRLGAIALWFLIAGLIAGLGAASIAEGANLTLAWDPSANNVDGSPLTDLAGYRIYYGTSSRSYTTIRNVGLVTAASVTNIPSGPACFFAVTAYDTAGNESVFSAELVWTGPVVDSDGDGMTDIQELSAGTDPFDPNSVLKMNRLYRPTGAGETGLVVEWSSVTGKHYRVERSTNLLTVPVFTSIVSNISGQSPITVYTDMTATGSGPYYYRVIVEQ